ncbi:MAG TPA: hypothetical protein VEV43_13390 [Actinomycetota bacterium]|nr:hypothetical protein [Actinomycetota bacterium]
MWVGWSRELWHLVVAFALVAGLAGLAAAGLWPFDAVAVGSGDEASIAERALGDRLTIGLIRTAVLAVVSYLVISVPALVIDRRWIQGLTTSGLTTDPQAAERWKEELVAELARLGGPSGGEIDPAEIAARIVRWDDEEEADD